MESVGSYCNECFDSSTYTLKSEECCYPYHLISYCIYKENKKITCTKKNNKCVRHLEQFEYMIPMSSVDKLISKNLHKMEETSILNKYFTSVQGKIIKTKDDSHEMPIMNVRRKTKINWNECFPERRRSRRLSNLPPVDDIKIEIKYEDISESFDSVTYNILSTTERIKNENDYMEQNIKLEPIDDVDEFQNDNMDICENISNDKSDLTSYKQNVFLQLDSENNCTQVNSSYTDNIKNTNTSGTLFNLDNTYIKSTDTYDYTNTSGNINLHQDKNHELTKVFKCWSKSALNQRTIFDTAKIQETPSLSKTYSIITETKEIPTVPKTYFGITKMEQIPSLTNTYSKPTEIENNSSLFKTYSRIIENEKIPSLPRKNVETTEVKDSSSVPETCSEKLELDKMISLSKYHSGYTEIKKDVFVPITTETHSEVIDTDKMLSLPKITEAKEIKSQHGTYSKIIETEEVLTVPKTYFEKVEIDESSPLPKKNSSSNKTNKILPSIETYFEIIDTEKIPSQFEKYSEITETNEIPYYPETFEIQEIPSKSETIEIPCSENIYSKMIQMQNSSSQPKISIINGPSLHKTYSNAINGLILQPVMTLKNRPILPKTDSQKIENQQTEYSKMTLQEKQLYRKKLTFVTALGLVTKEKLEQMYKKNNKNEEPTISKKDSSYLKVIILLKIIY